MGDKPFVFKQFEVHQDQCAMKIGTDGVLLGAWVPIEGEVNSILDIGTGTGVIALMMAQRSNAEIIDAIEIDELSYEQAVENFESSNWGDRLFCYHASFQEFFMEIEDVYDLLISNPPFYTEDYKSSNSARDQARFEDALPFEHLFYGVSKLLSENGCFALIIPVKEEQRILDIAKQVYLYPYKKTCVKGNSTAVAKRVLFLFGREEKECFEDELIIEVERHQYTDVYRELTKDFYLKI